MADQPLAGIRVFAMTRVLAGPYCTALLADLGASVIKLVPLTGNEYRQTGTLKDGESALFHLTNRGQHSIASDLRQTQGQLLAQDIADAAISPLTTARALKSARDHRRLGPIPRVGQPIPFDGAKPIAPRAAPRSWRGHGAYGFARALPPERSARDVRIMRTDERSSEIQRNLIAAHHLA